MDHAQGKATRCFNPMNTEYPGAMTDRTTKLILIAISIGLWLNSAAIMFRPLPVQAQNKAQSITLSSIEDHVMDIRVMVSRIENGTCKNGKLC